MKICGNNKTSNLNVNDLDDGTVFVSDSTRYSGEVFMKIKTVAGDDKENTVSLKSGRTFVFNKSYCEANRFIVKPNACVKLEG